jgi:hypothetical protein
VIFGGTFQVMGGRRGRDHEIVPGVEIAIPEAGSCHQST